MTYETALEKIHSLLALGIKPGLERMRELLNRMGNPQDKLNYIHVAGTNGKGSVCAMLSATLIAAGYKTGLFISPYITDFRERIQINNVMISKEMLTKAVEETFPLIEQLKAEGIVITEFEYVNALEFFIHAKENCDVVVLETGLGGLYDCTNVIKKPLCTVITTIGLDHTAILGNTIEEITEQKCGIIKEECLSATSKQEPAVREIIEATARKLHSPLAKSEYINLTDINKTIGGSTFTYEDMKLEINLAGEHQIENAKTALSAIEAIRLNNLLNITDESIVKGFASAVHPARLELMSKSPVVLLDGAHNPNGIEALSKSIKEFLPDKHITAIIGMMADKDSSTSLALLEGVFDEICTVPVNNPRAMNPAKLSHKCLKYFDNVTTFDAPQYAFDYAYDRAKRFDGAVVICGSLYLAGEIRPYIINKIKENS